MDSASHPPYSQHLSHHREQSRRNTLHPPRWGDGQQYRSNVTYASSSDASESKTSSEPCHNCGDSGHWAQNCSEPRRVAYSDTPSYPRPYKRQKLDGPVMSQDPGPRPPNASASNNWQPFGPKRSSTHPSFNHRSQQQRALPVSAAYTCHSPESAQHRKWPHSPPHRYHNQLLKSPQLRSLPSGQPPWRTNRASPISEGIHQHVPTLQTPMQYKSSAQEFNASRSSFGDLFHGAAPNSPPLKHSSPTSGGADGNSVKPDDSAQVEEKVEPWWEELRALDYIEGSGQQVFHPVNPVAEPLPSTMRDEDHVARLPIAASLPAGVPVSRYFRDINSQEFMQSHITRYPEENSDPDPALVSIPEEGGAISIEELKSACRARASTFGERDFEGVKACAEVAERPTILDDAHDPEALNLHAAEGLPSPSQSHESEEERQAREQEEKLAALGVTGFAKPVRRFGRRSVIPVTPTMAEVRGVSSGNDLYQSQSSEHIMKEQTMKLNAIDLKGYRFHDSSPRNDWGASSLQTPPTGMGYDSCSDDDDDDDDDDEKPTPQLLFNTQVEPLVESKHEHTFASDSRSPDHFYNRKRSPREISSGTDEGSKRQSEEPHKKEKRSAPTVAAAYRRRW